MATILDWWYESKAWFESDKVRAWLAFGIGATCVLFLFWLF